MFTCSAPLAFLDYFRIPHTVDPGAGAPDWLGELRGPGRAGRAARLYWCRSGAGQPAPRMQPGRYTLAGFTLVCPVLRSGSAARPGFLPSGARWRELEPVLDAEGRQVAAVWGADDGSVFLPFDPGAAMSWLWSERYAALGGGRVAGMLRRGLVTGYYAVRPLLPRHLQLLLRRGYVAHQELPGFPGWPAEHSLHDLYDWLFDVLAGVAGEPVPYLSPWPRGKQSALVLTHDVETHVGRDAVERLRAPEREHGYRSSWNFVPERYALPAALRQRLEAEGCEIGVHGLRHDGQDLASRRKLSRRLPAIRRYAEQWGAVGFRSPATQRSWDLMPTLGFDYDSSYTDSAPHEPQPGGCCTYLPFFVDGMVELPLTLPQDHTLFEILGHTDGQVWRRKAEQLRERGGMVLVIAHPDYVECPGMLEAWRDLLAQFAGDGTVWQALPREVATWWRERAASTPILVDGSWTVSGPASARAEVRYAGAPVSGSHRAAG